MRKGYIGIWVNKEGRTVGGNKGRVKKVAKMLASFESLLQEKVVIWQDSKVFLAVCDRAADVYSWEVELIGNGQQKCQSHHSIFYTLLHNVTIWKVLVENTFGKSLKKPNDDHHPEERQAHTTQMGGPDG